MKIVVLDGYTLNPGDNPWTRVESLGDFTCHDRTPEADILSRSQGADIILTNKTPLTKATLDALPDLKFIGVLATGYNIVDVEAAAARGIPVTNVPTYGTDSVAEFVLGLMLDHARGAHYHSYRVKDGEWARRGDFCFWDHPLSLLKGKTLSVVGFGRIGRRTAELAHAFGMDILAYDIVQEAKCDFPFDWVDIPEAFARGDYVSLHCPQTADNAKMVSADLIRTMKPTAFFINTARGGLVDEQALAAALSEGQISGAALDVVSAEPIRPDNPLLGAKNVTLTPHIAWAAVEARVNLMNTVADNIGAFQSGQPINVVNGV